MSVQINNADVKDLDFIRAAVLKLKQTNKDKILLSMDSGLDDLTIDMSAFISNGKAPSESDQRHIELFENLIFRSLRCIYQETLTDYLTSFKSFLKTRKISGTDPKGNYRYPLLEMYVRDRNIGGPVAPRRLLGEFELLPYGYVTEPGMYETSVTCPTLFERYLRRQIRQLIENHAPVMRVRTGPRYLPIHFAIEAHALGEIPEMDELQDLIKKIDMATSNEMQLYFDVPELGHIHDIAQPRYTEAVKVPSLEFINEHFFRQQRSYKDICATVRKICYEENVVENQGYERDVVFRRVILSQQIKLKTDEMKREFEIKPLSIFNGDRIDYSLGRIRHYTKTAPSHFQNFVIFTNYQMYVEEFVKYCVAHILIRVAHRRGDLCDLPAILAELGKGQIVISAEQLRQLADDDVEIAVPVYDKAGTSAKADENKPFSAKHILDNGILIVREGDCRFDRTDRKVYISKADLNTCVEKSLLKVFSGKLSLEQATSSESKGKEEVFSRLASELFGYFLQDRNETGILGPKIPQMPAYHLTREDQSGISMVNIGVGPSNAKTITDHISVLRPYSFLMLGHCAGLRATQQLGHYVLANGYLRADGVLDVHSRIDLPIPPITEIHDALEAAFSEVTGLPFSDKTIRNGTVATTLDRNWELEYPDPDFPLERAKAIGADMESATIAANGFRYSVPYATFLCVSDRPLHGDLKLEGMADSFYRDAVARHFRIAIAAVEKLCVKYGDKGVPTRKLRDRLQPPFQ
ncbi:MAG: nucleosidase [Bradyrhizobium sp.]|nr:nucleosidase [Bradyrhizobium sp.]